LITKETAYCTIRCSCRCTVILLTKQAMWVLRFTQAFTK